MKALDQKRARLRLELQQAYSAWMLTSESCGDSAAAFAAVDISGCPGAAKVKWFEYLAAKRRLVLAYAEQPVSPS